MFVALDLPAKAREELASWRDELVEGRRDLRPVRVEALHVTLVFLGWQDEAAADAIGAERGERRVPALAGEPPPAAPFTGAELTLYRSTLRPQGALYEPLARAPAASVQTQ